MQTKPVLGVAEIDDMLAAARSEAQRHGWAVSIALVDDGAHPVALVRLDGVAPSSAYLATEKARGTGLIFSAWQLHRVTPLEEGLRHSLVAWITGEPFR